MTICAHSNAPCWVVVDSQSGRPHGWDSGDGVPHYATPMAALVAIAAAYDDVDDEPDGPPRLQARPAHPTPCVGVFCEECDEVADLNDEGWTHLDPGSHSPALDLGNIGWIESADGRHHWHDDCYPGDSCPNNRFHPHEYGDDADACRHCDHPRIADRRIPVGPGQLSLDELLDHGVAVSAGVI